MKIDIDGINIVFLVITIVLSLAFTFSTYYKAKKSKVLYVFIIFNILVIIWCFGLILELVADNGKGFFRLLIPKFYYLGICFLGVTWLLFCLFYINSDFVKRKRNIALLLSFPAAFYLFLLTNEHHNLFYIVKAGQSRRFGLVADIHLVVSYIYILIGMALLIRFSMRNSGKSRHQAVVNIFACVIPSVGSVIRIYYSFKVEFIPFLFIVTFILFYISSFKYRLFSVVPVSIMTFIESLKQSIVIVDTDFNIASCNLSFYETFNCGNIARVNYPVKPFCDYLKSIAEQNKESLRIIETMEVNSAEIVQGEIMLDMSEKKAFSVVIQPVVNRKGGVLARIISFNDVTEYKKLNNELKTKNDELKGINDRLLEHALTIEELAVTKERNRILSDLHDSVGHTFSVMIALIDFCKTSLRKDIAITEEKLYQMSKISREGLDEIRNSIYNLKHEIVETASLTNSLEKLFEDFKKSGLEVDFSSEGVIINVEYPIRYAIYKICQETLTNSIKHGEASCAHVIIQLNDDGIRLFVFDNGRGCNSIEKGFGLKGIEERVFSLNGQISYGSFKDSGFNVCVKIPLI